MNVPDDRSENLPEPQAAQRLAEDLSALYGQTPVVGPEVDETIFAMARRSLRRGRIFQFIVRRGAVAATAAALLLGFWLLAQPDQQPAAAPVCVPRAGRPATRAPVTAAVEDIDRNGRVDILDAFALARRVQARSAERREWDVNQDGVVNQGDVKTIAMAAVKLN